MTLQMKCYQNGVTLVELLIVIAIVGILAGIAYPSYQSHVESTRHSDAKVKLLEIMQLQRRYFTDNNTYTDQLVGDLGLQEAGTQEVETDNGFYLISAAQCNGNPNNLPLNECVQLTATAIFGDGTETLTYNSRNIKGGPTGAW